MTGGPDLRQIKNPGGPIFGAFFAPNVGIRYARTVFTSVSQ
jgi:hypothetical protein